MFWNKKEEIQTLDEPLIELGREVERGLLLLNSLVLLHWDQGESAYHKIISQLMDELLRNPDLTDDQRVTKSQEILAYSKVYKNHLDEKSNKYGDFVLKKNHEFEKLLISNQNNVLQQKALEWSKLSTEICMIRANEMLAIDIHIQTDEFIPNIFIVDKGAQNHQMTEQMKEEFAHLCASYATKRKTAHIDEDKIEPRRSLLSKELFGNLNDYVNGGSYSELSK